MLAMERMTIGSLFAGIGGFDLAFERQGFEMLWQCEINADCANLLEAKFPKTERWIDVTDFNPDDWECPDAITFGSPCQDLSVAGQRKGINGERSGLFFHATRIIQRFVGRGLQFAVWENVPGAFSSNGGRDFAAVLAGLGKCGALDIAWRVLDAQWFGLAQRRKRIFLVADFRGQRAAEILSLAESLQGHPAPSREKGESIAPTVEGRAGRSGETNFATSGGLVPFEIAQTLKVSAAHLQANLVANPVAAHHSRQDLDQDTYVLAHGQANAECVKDCCPTLTQLHEAPIVARSLNAGRDGYNDGSDQTYIPILEAGARTGKSTDDLRCSDGVGKPGDPMFTLQSGKQHAIAFSSKDSGADAAPCVAGAWGVRRLTPLECERLMGLPDGWTAGFSDSCRYRMLGNSVAVPVVEWIAKRVKNFLVNSPTPPTQSPRHDQA